MLVLWPMAAPRAVRAGLKSMRQLQMQEIERQTLDYSCGAAALAILLRLYFGHPLHEQDVLADIIVRLPKPELADRIKNGFSMLDLKQSAQRMGYAATGVRLNMEQAMRLKGPVIVLLYRDGLKHFVVLKGIVQGRALLADAVRGHVRLPLHELAQQWHGETLVVGREQFGFSSFHALAPAYGNAVAPEQESVRALRHLPLN